MPFQQITPSRHGPRYADTVAGKLRHAGIAEAPQFLDRCRARRAAGPVERGHTFGPGIPIERKTVAPYSRGDRLDNIQSGGRGDRGVGRVSPRLQDRQSCLGCKRLTRGNQPVARQDIAAAGAKDKVEIHGRIFPKDNDTVNGMDL